MFSGQNSKKNLTAFNPENFKQIQTKNNEPTQSGRRHNHVDDDVAGRGWLTLLEK